METGRLLVSLIHYPVYVLGPGKRVGLWTQGCKIRCPGCISKHTWEFDESKAMDVEQVARILKEFNCDRLTISGGEPFDQAQDLFELLKMVREHFKDILVYTGYKMEDIKRKHKEHLCLIDAIVDGRFIEGLESEYAYKGSENQRLFILNRELLERYSQWMHRRKDKMLQVVRLEDKIYLIGIPYQKHAKELSYEIQNMPKL